MRPHESATLIDWRACTIRSGVVRSWSESGLLLAYGRVGGMSEDSQDLEGSQIPVLLSSRVCNTEQRNQYAGAVFIPDPKGPSIIMVYT